MLDVCLSLAIALSTIQVIEQFGSVHPNFEGEHHSGRSGVFHFFSLPPVSQGLAALQIFSVLPYPEGTIYLQTTMPSPEFKSRPYGRSVSVINH
ncbi:hypothetical protein TNCV_2947811 [Trichonephila clavipes]|nr:hypothetical protein TNCV_2947811 [Trichonephila clavipes]